MEVHAEMLQELEGFPHSFQLKINVERLAEHLRKQEREELEKLHNLSFTAYPHEYQRARVYNFLTFVR
jgi:hypothetical protein